MSCPPALSVVIAATDSAGAVERTVASLLGQRDAARLEVLVVAARDRIASRVNRPGVRWIAAEAGAGVPRLRRLGFDHAGAPIVVFTEDSCQFGPDWAGRWIEAFTGRPIAAATGPVEPILGASGWDWAVFFCEYAPFLAGRRPVTGPPARLAGNHFGLRRSVRDAIDGAEIHETEVSGALPAPLALVPARAEHVRRYSVREAIGHRLRFGFEFGRLRARGQSLPLRAVGVLAGPAILAVQAARLTAVVLGRGRYLDRFAESLPITLALLTAWSVGEWLGRMSAPRRPAPARRQRGRADPPPARPTGRSGWRRPRCTAGPASA